MAFKSLLHNSYTTKVLKNTVTQNMFYRLCKSYNTDENVKMFMAPDVFKFESNTLIAFRPQKHCMR